MSVIVGMTIFYIGRGSCSIWDRIETYFYPNKIKVHEYDFFIQLAYMGYDLDWQITVPSHLIANPNCWFGLLLYY